MDKEYYGRAIASYEKNVTTGDFVPLCPRVGGDLASVMPKKLRSSVPYGEKRSM